MLPFQETPHREEPSYVVLCGNVLCTEYPEKKASRLEAGTKRGAFLRSNSIVKSCLNRIVVLTTRVHIVESLAIQKLPDQG